MFNEKICHTAHSVAYAVQVCSNKLLVQAYILSDGLSFYLCDQ